MRQQQKATSLSYLLQVRSRASRWSPAVFSVSGAAGLIAALNAAEANADSLSLIKLDPGSNKLTNQLIHVAQGKTLAIIGQGQGATYHSIGRAMDHGDSFRLNRG
jgi:hypothetical protein